MSPNHLLRGWSTVDDEELRLLRELYRAHDVPRTTPGREGKIEFARNELACYYYDLDKEGVE